MTVLAKKIILGVTGGIAAYKAPELVRRLLEQGAEVQVIMTASACEFVKPLVFQAVSGNRVHQELLDEAAEAGMGHIELAAPKFIVLLGNVSLSALTNLTGVMKNRGQWQTISIGDKNIPALPIYHPALLIKQPALKKEALREFRRLTKPHGAKATVLKSNAP